MESQMFDNIKIEKEKAIAKFNCFSRIAKLRQFFEVALVLGLILWSSPPLLGAAAEAAACAVEFSTFLFNHHVVFIIENAIIISLFLLCRQSNDAAPLSADELYNEYVMHSEAAVYRRDSDDLPPTDGGEEEEISECDDLAAAIEKARRQIKRFERTHSVKLKREFRAALQRSEAAEIERLSSEEFRRTVDDFIDKNWCGNKTKQSI